MQVTYQVLIVDDEEIVCRGMAQFVKWKEHGFEVAAVAYSAQEALEYLKKRMVDVIFLDIRMPGMSGLEMLKETSLICPNTKTVILSGYSEFEYAKEALRYGVFEYLNKPVNLKEIEYLLDRLAAELKKRETEDEVKKSRLEALLLSIARGYTRMKEDQYQLPLLKNWYGISMELRAGNDSEEEAQCAKTQFQKEIRTVVPDAMILNNQLYGMFALLPFKTESEIADFTQILEQAAERNGGWSLGGSRKKYGYQELTAAYAEAEQALRYSKARESHGMIWYKNIELLFPKEIPEMTETASELTAILANPMQREHAFEYLERVFECLRERQLNLAQIQAACIGCLIELNGILKDRKLERNLSDNFNKILETILLCGDMDATRDCILGYVKKLIEKLDAADEHQLAKGIIREIQMYIRKHYQEPLTLQLLADQFYLHPNYLSRLFKEKTGENFVDYVTKIRMEHVKELLADPERKIGEISAEVGYDNPRYFSKVFKQVTGLTPSEYRETLN